MKAREHIILLQNALGIPQEKLAPNIGPLTKAAINRLEHTPLDQEFLIPAPEEVNNFVNNRGRDVNQRTLELVKHFEGLCLRAYQDPVGVWTIGWGHTGLQHEDGTVYPGRVITVEEAERLLRYDMDQFEAAVQALVKVALTDDQYGALVSFHFNTGGLGRSTMLQMLNNGNYASAADQFTRWNKAGGRVLPGLTRRRLSEKNLYNGLENYIIH
jgi:lysozyme